MGGNVLAESKTQAALELRERAEVEKMQKNKKMCRLFKQQGVEDVQRSLEVWRDELKLGLNNDNLRMN